MCIPARYYRRRRPLPVLLGWDVDADGTRREGHVHALEPIADETLVGRFWSQTVEQGRPRPPPASW